MNRLSISAKVFTVGSVCIISLFLYTAFFTIPSADDYDYGQMVRQFGFWPAQIKHYIEWSGRYFATFLLTFLSLEGYGQYWLVGWSCIIALFLSVVILLRAITKNLLSFTEVAALSISLIALFLSVTTAGSGHGVKVINEGFFWFAGAISYVISLANYLLLLTLFYYLVQKKLPNFGYLVFFILLACTIGMNETVMFLICITFVPLLVLFWWQGRVSLGVLATSITVIALFSAFMVFAPGNTVRMATSDGGNLLSAFGVCFEKFFQIVFFYLINPLIWLFVFSFLPILMGIKSRLSEIILPRNFLFIGCGIIYLLYLPVAYSLNSGAPDRLVAFISFFALILCIGGVLPLVEFLGKRFASSKAIAVLTVLTAISAFIFLQPLLSAADAAIHGPDFLEAHQKRWLFIKNAKNDRQKRVDVDNIPRQPLLLFEDLIEGQPNKTYASYFGLEEVWVKKGEKKSIPTQ